MKRICVAVLAVCLFVAAALAATSFKSTPSAGAYSVLVTDEGFSPQTIYIVAGQTVTWEWAGTNPHSVTESSVGWFDSGVHTAPHTFSYTFTQQSPFPGGRLYHQYESVPDGGTGPFVGTIVVDRVGTITPTPSPSPTSTPTPIVAGDDDADGVANESDNCRFAPNPGQENLDAAPLDNGPNAPDDDISIARGDLDGDACDTDIDNDYRSNANESNTCQGMPPTDPLRFDTDGDHLGDYYECAYLSDPTDPNSRHIDTAMHDYDQDRVPDVWEARGYYIHWSGLDMDGDGCHDLVEIASIDANYTIGDSDRLAVARRALNIWAPGPAQDYVLDISKNGTVGDEDRLFVARAALLPDWVPKSCT